MHWEAGGCPGNWTGIYFPRTSREASKPISFLSQSIRSSSIHLNLQRFSYSTTTPARHLNPFNSCPTDNTRTSPSRLSQHTLCQRASRKTSPQSQLRVMGSACNIQRHFARLPTRHSPSCQTGHQSQVRVRRRNNYTKALSSGLPSIYASSAEALS